MNQIGKNNAENYTSGLKNKDATTNETKHKLTRKHIHLPGYVQEAKNMTSADLEQNDNKQFTLKKNMKLRSFLLYL